MTISATPTKMDISKYTSYFHDGELISIFHENGNLELSMESAEVSENDLDDNIILSVCGLFPSIRGKLCFGGLRKITLNGHLLTGKLTKTHDIFDIFHLEIKRNWVKLQLILKNDSEEDEDEDFCEIIIEADTIEWEDAADTALKIDQSIQRLLCIETPKEELGAEFALILGSPFPDYGFERLLQSGIIQQWLQEAIRGTEYEGKMSPWSMDQNSIYHTLTLDQHTLLVLKNSLPLHQNDAPEKKLVLRLTAICHDLGKMYQPIHRRNESGSTSYHGHEDHSAVLTEHLLKYLKLDHYIVSVKPLVQHHMRPHELVKCKSAKAIRKLLRDLAEEGVQWSDLLKQAEADATAKRAKFGQEEKDYLANLNLLREKITQIEQEIKKQSVSADKPLLNGFQLMEAFNRHDPGRWISEILNWIQEEQLSTRLSLEETVAIVKARFPQYIK